jgi:hypothetical protein
MIDFFVSRARRLMAFHTRNRKLVPIEKQLPKPRKSARIVK